MADTTALYQEGEKLREEGKYAEAVEKFKAILAEKPDHVLSHMALGVTYGNLNQFAEACEHAEKVCQLEPNDPFNFTALSVTYQKAFEVTRDPIYIQKAEQAKAQSDMSRGGM
ncbi:tetratricopeptide repeat protein [bacterium]|nr:tetratricopeptide repeat protein [bacterium]